MKKYLLLFLLVVIAYGLYAQTTSNVIEASQLTKEYDENELRANNRYKNRILTITGEIRDIRQYLDGTYYIALSGHKQFMDVRVNVHSSQLNKLEKLNKGQKITISGNCYGIFFMDVVIRDSYILN